MDVITEKIGAELDMSQIEDDHFRFIQIDVRTMTDGIEILMVD